MSISIQDMHHSEKHWKDPKVFRPGECTSRVYTHAPLSSLLVFPSFSSLCLLFSPVLSQPHTPHTYTSLSATERFFPENNPPLHAFLPFAVGNHNCIGNNNSLLAPFLPASLPLPLLYYLPTLTHTHIHSHKLTHLTHNNR